jgi:hypothetical protein
VADGAGTTAAELLERHKPLLRYDSQGSFFTGSARMMAERVSGDPETMNCLKRDDGGTIASAARPPGDDSLTLGYLAPRRYGGAETVSRDDYLDAVGGDYVLQARELYAEPDIADRVYGHIALDDGGARWLQYWFFYYYNDKAFLGFGLHEVDWEMVQIGLDAGAAPAAVTFAQHTHGERCTWAAAEKHEGERPIVYIARGSQASYPRPGRHRAPIVPDIADGKGAEISPTLEVLDDPTPRWVGWPGRWGSTRARTIAESDSPRGPAQHGQWKRPADFHDDAVERLGLTGMVLGQPELPIAPRPRIKAHRSGDRAVVEYTFPSTQRGEAPATQIVVSVDSPDDGLPPATYAFPAESKGTIEHPLPLEDRRYVVRASGSTREAVASDTAEVRLGGERR